MDIRSVLDILRLPSRVLSIFRSDRPDPPIEAQPGPSIEEQRPPAARSTVPKPVMPAKRLTGAEAARAIGAQDTADPEAKVAEVGDTLREEVAQSPVTTTEGVRAKRLTGAEAARAIGAQDTAGPEAKVADFGDMLWDEADNQR